MASILDSILSPFIKTGKTIGGAGYEAQRALRQVLGDSSGYIQNGKMVQNPFLSEQELTKYSTNPLEQILKQAGQSAAVASYAIPFGKGANVLSKFLLPGAAVGGLQSLSEDKVTPESVAMGAGGGALGAGALGGLSKVLGKAGGTLTKKIPESLMGKIFKEPIKQSKSALTTGTELGKEALKRGVKGSSESIYNQALSKIDDFENVLQKSLSSSSQTVDINDILKTTQPLIDSYKKSGNQAAATALENRIMNIWQANGEKIPVSLANEIKRDLYKEVGNAYGATGSEAVEGLKTVARGIKETIAKKVPEIMKINEELGVWGRIRDSMKDKLVRGGRNQFPGLTDTILLGTGVAGAPATGGASLLPFLGKLGMTTGVQTSAANTLNQVGKTASNIGGNQLLNNILGQTAARGGQSVVPGMSPQIQSSTNNNQYQNPQAHTQSVTQPVNGALQGAKPITSEDGQWKWDHQANDWVPNDQAQAQQPQQQGWTREQIGQAMLADLQLTGGKNLAELKTLSEFVIPEENKKKPLTAVQQQLATNVDSANRAINKVEEFIKKDPSIILKAEGPLGTSRLLGASSYNTARKEIADVLARMRTGAVINDEEMANYLSKLPQVGDSPEDITYKMGELRFIFQALKERLENQSGPDLQINAAQ